MSIRLLRTNPRYRNNPTGFSVRRSGLDWIIADARDKALPGKRFSSEAAAKSELAKLDAGAVTMALAPALVAAPRPAAQVAAQYTPPPQPRAAAPAPPPEPRLAPSAPPPPPMRQAESSQRTSSGFSAAEEQAMVSAMGRDIDASGIAEAMIPPGWEMDSTARWTYDPENPRGGLYAITKGNFHLWVAWSGGAWQISLMPSAAFWTYSGGSATEALWRAAEQVERWAAAGRISENDDNW